MDPKDEQSPARTKSPRVLAFVKRRGPLVALLVVAAALLYLARDDGSHPALPDYALVSTGEGAGRLELGTGADAVFELVLRPSSAVPAKVVAYVFGIGEGEPNAVDAKVEIAADGVVRVNGRARALAGAREVRVVVGPASDFKRYEDALSRARDGKSDGQVRVVVVPLVRVRR